MFWLLTHEFKNYFYFILLRRSPRRGPSHDSSATHSSLCGAALLGPENHQKRPPQPAWRKNSKRYSFPALQPGQIKKLFLKNVFFLLSRMECCSTFLRPTFLLEPEPEPVKQKNRSRSKMDRFRNTDTHTQTRQSYRVGTVPYIPSTEAHNRA